jgi:RNA ligase (TIGR02306 family)
MSDFSVNLFTIEYISPHPDVETTNLELVHINGYQCVVQKKQFAVSDVVFYIPEQAIVPDYILDDLGLKGMLAGKNKNRVKAIKLRGVLSQGILYPLNMTDITPVPDEDFDYSEALNIAKYEPPIPTNMSGTVAHDAMSKYLFKFDFNDVKKSKDLDFAKGESVFITEKLHGTFVQFVYCVDEDKLIVSSKGLSKQGLYLQDSPENENNLYIKMGKRLDLLNKFRELVRMKKMPSYLTEHVKAWGFMGEIVGPGVQDLTYGLEEPEFFHFAAFAYIDDRGLREIDVKAFFLLNKLFQLEIVPLVGYIDDWTAYEDIKNLEEYSETVLGSKSHMAQDHIREGVVFCQAEIERGAVALKRFKYITPEYLLRKNGTEYN